jgi:hypothetical protein
VNRGLAGVGSIVTPAVKVKTRAEGSGMDGASYAVGLVSTLATGAGRRMICGDRVPCSPAFLAIGQRQRCQIRGHPDGHAPCRPPWTRPRTSRYGRGPTAAPRPRRYHSPSAKKKDTESCAPRGQCSLPTWGGTSIAALVTPEQRAHLTRTRCCASVSSMRSDTSRLARLTASVGALSSSAATIDAYQDHVLNLLCVTTRTQALGIQRRPRVFPGRVTQLDPAIFDAHWDVR